MSVDQLLTMLESESGVAEAYVLFREIKVVLNVGDDLFHPSIGIKIYRSNAIAGQPYHFEVSHHVHTPTQAGPYRTSRTWSETEESAVGKAISTTTTFLKEAIAKGHAPRDEWLVPNEDF